MSIMIDAFADAISKIARTVAKAAEQAAEEFQERVAQVPAQNHTRSNVNGTNNVNDGGDAVTVVPALWVQPTTEGETEVDPAVYRPTTAGPGIVLADYDTGEPQPAGDEAFQNLNDPVSQALRGVLRAIAADPTTDPQARKVNDVVKAAVEAYLWAKEAERLKGIALDKKTATDTAATTYGEGSPQHVQALAEQRAAEAAYLEALARSNEAWAQLEVYALDPEYRAALGPAQRKINEALGPHGLEFTMPEPQGTLEDARNRLTERQRLTQMAVDAGAAYAEAAGLIDRLPEGYVPGRPYNPPSAVIQDPDNAKPFDQIVEEGRQRHATNERNYSDAWVKIAEGDKLLADLNVDTIVADLAVAKPGSKQHTDLTNALPGARQAQTAAGTNLTNAQLIYNYWDAVASASTTELDKQALEQQALAALRERMPHLFKPEGYTNASNGFDAVSGDLQGIHVEERGGQLWVEFTYENWDDPIEIQLTFAPGQRRNGSAAQNQLDADWAAFNRGTCTGATDQAWGRVTSAELALQQGQQQELNLLIPQLQQKYQDAIGRHPIPQGHNPGTPGDPAIHPEVADAWNQLQYAQGMLSQVNANIDFLNFLQTQSLSNMGDPAEQGRLRQVFFTQSAGERQRQFNQAGEIYGNSVTWQSGPELTNGTGVALGMQPANYVDGDKSQHWFSPEQRDALKPVTDKITEIGGTNARVQVAPIVLAQEDGQLYRTSLFVVTTKDGGTRIVDETGRDYDNFDDYLDNHRLPGTGTLYYPENLQFTRDGAGNVNIAQTEVEGDPMNVVDGAVAIGTTVATVASFFPPLAPVAVPLAIAGGAYLGVRSGMRIYDMVDHGESLWSKQGMMEIAMVTTSALPIASGVTRTVGLFRQGMTFTAATRSGFGAISGATPYAADAQILTTANRFRPAFLAANVMDAGGIGVGTPLMTVSAYDLAVNWDQMSTFDRVNGIMGLGSGAFGTGMGARGLYRTYRGTNGVAPVANPRNQPQVQYRPGGQQRPVGGQPIVIVQSPGQNGHNISVINTNGTGPRTQTGGPAVHGTGNGNGTHGPAVQPFTTAALPEGSIYFDPSVTGTPHEGDDGASVDPRQTGRATPLNSRGEGLHSYLPISAEDRHQFETMLGDVHRAFIGETGGIPRGVNEGGAVVHVSPRPVLEAVYSQHVPGETLPPDALGFVTYQQGQGQRIYLSDTLVFSPEGQQRATAAHEFAHFYMHPAFVDMASRLVIGDGGNPHANLGEGAADFVGSRVATTLGNSDPAGSPYGTESGIVGQIAISMGRENLYKAMFHGDADALRQFHTLATARTDVSEVGPFTSDLPGLMGANYSVPPPIKGTGRAADETRQVLRNGTWYNAKTGEPMSIHGTGRASDESRQVLVNGHWYNLGTGERITSQPRPAAWTRPAEAPIPAGHIRGTGRAGDAHRLVLRNGAWYNAMTGAPASPAPAAATAAPVTAPVSTTTASTTASATGPVTAPVSTATASTTASTTGPVTAPVSTATASTTASTTGPVTAPVSTATASTTASTTGPVTAPVSTTTASTTASTTGPVTAPVSTTTASTTASTTGPVTVPVSTTSAPPPTVTGATVPTPPPVTSTPPVTVPTTTGPTTTGTTTAQYTQAHIFAAQGADGRPIVFIRLGGPDALNPDNPVPNPNGERRLKPLTRFVEWVGRAPRRVLEKKGNYSEQVYRDLYNGASPTERAGMPHPDRLTFDDNTLAIALVPGGLEKVLADIHAHSMGYDRRVGDLFDPSSPIALLNKSGLYSRILFGPIPQFCGGDAHYSTSTPSAATLADAQRLDLRLVTDYRRLYETNPALAAKGDLSLTGLDFSTHGTQDPVAYARQMMLDHPGFFNFIGEVTGVKEMVFRQLGPFGWHLHPGDPGYSTKFVDYMDFAAQTGQGVLLHYDWGEHNVTQAGRPAPHKQGYEHFPDLINLFSQPKYRDLNIVFAHTGIGRYVRPNDAVRTATHAVRDLQGNHLYDRTVTGPEHIHKLYELFDQVPNARADISWNDVTQAYADNPHLRDALVNFVIDNQDRLIFGSDTVKPVNTGQYNQALNTGSPMFARIALRDPNALWKLLRGNYDTVMSDSQTRVAAWTNTELRNAGRSLTAIGMADRHTVLDGHRAQLSANARSEFDNWVQTLYDRRDAFAAHTGDPDFLAKMLGEDGGTGTGTLVRMNTLTATNNALPSGVQFLGLPAGTTGSGPHLPATTGSVQPTVDRLPVAGTGPGAFARLPSGDQGQLSLTSRGGQLGERTSGGRNEDSRLRYVGAVAGGTVVTAGSGTTFLYIDGTPVDAVNAGAFGVRGGLISLKAVYGEKIRLDWEMIFEEGAVTRQTLDRFVGRVFGAKKALNLSDGQLLEVGALTEQFWANYQFLRDLPVTPESARVGWTEQQRFHAIMAKVGEYQIGIDRALGTQASSINALDPRRGWGRAYLTATLGTYGVNNYVFADWIASGGYYYDPAKPIVLQIGEMVFMTGFGAANGILTGTTAMEAGGGFAGVNVSTRAPVKWARNAGSWVLTLSGGLWTSHTGATAVEQFMSGNVTGGLLNTAAAVSEGAFTWYAGKAARNDTGKLLHGDTQSPERLARPMILLGGALIATQAFGVVADLFQDEPKPDSLASKWDQANSTMEAYRVAVENNASPAEIAQKRQAAETAFNAFRDAYVAELKQTADQARGGPWFTTDPGKAVEQRATDLGFTAQSGTAWEDARLAQLLQDAKQYGVSVANTPSGTQIQPFSSPLGNP